MYALAGIAALAGVAAGVALTRGGGAESRCEGAAVRAESAWPAATAARVRATPWGDKVAAALDTASSRWATSYTAVCEATRVRGEQSDRLLEVRMACLERALGRTGEFARAVDGPMTAAERATAVLAVQALPDPTACEGVVDGAMPSADPERDAHVAAARAQLDRAWAAYQLGRYKPARALLDVSTWDAVFPTAPITQGGAATGGVHGPFVASGELAFDNLAAERLALAGAIDGRIGDAAGARRELQDALVAAAHAPAIERDAWAHLLRLELFAGEPARAIEWEPFAQAAAARAGQGSAELDAILGEAYRDEHRYALARDRLARAATGTLRPDQRALVDMNLGSVALAVGDLDTARTRLEAARDDATRMLGADHPELAIYLDKLAALARARGDITGALALHETGLALRRAAFGENDRAVATGLFHRAETLLEAGRLADARADLDRARALRVKAYGDHSARLGEIDAALGDVAVAGGDPADALARYDAAAGEDRRLDLAARRHAAGQHDVLDGESHAGEREVGDREADRRDELSIDSAERVAAVVDQLARAGDPVRARTMALRLRDQWRGLKSPVAPALSCAVGDALARAGEDGRDAYDAALAQLADQPSRTRLRTLAGLGRDIASLRAAMPELRDAPTASGR